MGNRPSRQLALLGAKTLALDRFKQPDRALLFYLVMRATQMVWLRSGCTGAVLRSVE